MKQRKINISNFVKTNFILLTFIFCYANINAQEVDNNSPEDVAKKLANPVAAMISVPFQNNMDLGIGEYNGSRNILNFQPVLPFSISEKYNLITRLVLPIVYQTNIYVCRLEFQKNTTLLLDWFCLLFIKRIFMVQIIHNQA